MSLYTVHVRIDEEYRGRATASLFRSAARAALKHQHVVPPAAVAIVLTCDEALRDLNQRFLGHNRPTDVLSFPADLADAELEPGQPRHLGDIAISYPRALAQAKKARHSVETELSLLAVHGVLHLLGHDHDTPARKRAMWKDQKEILGRFEI